MLCNIDRARAEMDRRGWSTIVATTSSTVLYLSDFENDLPFETGTRAAAVLPADPEKEAALVVAKAYVPHLAVEPTWMPRVEVFGRLGVEIAETGVTREPEIATVQLLEELGGDPHPDLTTALTAALETAGATHGTVAIDDLTIAGSLSDRFRRVTWEDARPGLAAIRLVKTEEEVRRLRRASEINDRAFADALAVATAGARWIDVLTTWRRTWVEHAGLPRFWGGGAGAHAAQFYPDRTDYEIATGDLIRLEGGGTYRGYWADTGGTAYVGRPDARIERYVGALNAGAATARDAIGPGVRAGDVVDAVLSSIRGNGIPDFASSNAWGHGIGLALNEGPFLRSPADEALEPGMVLCFETPYFELGWGGLQVENTFVVTDTGNELISVPSVAGALA